MFYPCLKYTVFLRFSSHVRPLIINLDAIFLHRLRLDIKSRCLSPLIVSYLTQENI